jgi:alpha-1,3-glucan synthase
MQIAMLDIDGFRIDKALQTTLDAHASFSSYQRQCARRHGKENFLIVGEAVGEVPFEALYFGRGRKPDRKEMNATAAMLSSNESDPNSYLRKWGNGALDAAAFHYPTYGALTRFLGFVSNPPYAVQFFDFLQT